MAICLLADRIFEERERIRLYGEVEWYAIHVRPRFDRVVAVHLKKQNVEHYLPLRRVTRRSSIPSIKLPLLPVMSFAALKLAKGVR